VSNGISVLENEEFGIIEKTSYFKLVQSNYNFRNLWFGQIISLLGDWFNLIASAALVAALTESGLAVGSLFVVRMLSPFIMSPFAGVVADRYNRKKILIATDILRTFTAFGFLLVNTPEEVWLLYALTALQLAIGGFFYPARNALLPEIVATRDLGTANALSSVTWSVMLAFGAALGGIVSGAIGLYPAFAIDGCTFLVSAFFLSRIGLADSTGTKGKKTIISAIHEYLEGLKYLVRNPDILVITLHKAALGLLLFATFDVVQIAVAEKIFIIGIGGGIGLGAMFAVTGLGTGLGPVLVRKKTGDEERKLRRALVYAYLVGGTGLSLWVPLWNFPSVLLGNLLRGFGGGIIWVFSTQLLLILVPAEIRGRVFATELAIFTLMSAIGTATSGWLLDSALGIPGICLGMAILTIIPATLWAFWINRSEKIS
jgi:MFS family permease